MNLTKKLIDRHLVDGQAEPGEEIGLRIDQALLQDATGTLVMLELEAMGLDRVEAEVAAQYVDHNLLQVDNKNPDDHLFLRSACDRFGVRYGRAGIGVSHPVHQQRFGRPGDTLLGSDSHTPAAGSLGMLAIGGGGIEVALALAGEPFYIEMPEVWGIRLTGSLPDWVSAKDVILELLRRHDVDGATGCVLEYHGPGVAQLDVMDRHVIANMGTELGATSTVFPTDDETRRFLRRQQREGDFCELAASEGASYDREEEIDLAGLEPLIAMPSSPGNVVPVGEVAGETIHQAYIGSSANPGYRDFAVAAAIVEGQQVAEHVSFDVNPTSRQLLINLSCDGWLAKLLDAGARLHQAGCNGCIGMGQAPATDTISLRTVPRNFPGRSGTREDKVCLVSPETAAASALRGCITDPRSLERACPRPRAPEEPILDRDGLAEPPAEDEAEQVELRKGPNVVALPELDPLPDRLRVPVLLEVGDDLSTDEIMPAGARVLPLRSNIPEISKFCFESIDDRYHEKARERREDGGHAIIAGDNYGQGSSREHAALAPRFLGLRLVIARSFARIHRQNLVNFGVLPLTFREAKDRDCPEPGSILTIEKPLEQLRSGARVEVQCSNPARTFDAEHDLSERQLEVLAAGGIINFVRQKNP